MQNQSRIPKLRETTFDSALLWFSELQCNNLLFHPEDDPAEIVRISDGKLLFSDVEIEELRFLLNELEAGIGHEKVIEAAYPVFMNAFGNQLDA
ncbi:MAG: hypothetical protein B7Y56_08245 [Gallionellales bacterium 35-53-114]|jgi:hypothetical protein|nr:MAG: hypothetical protein B7Y56_08245 [Gallionellales bacterium 35-53-114]OYZ62618.1 MAG: hypothetical protein B7Y04_12100 [Gallionellales bacterium 24-53-125]OZB09692.1 MAG: hypothetical protein B7X61_04000 [Gallionellales bacterium 39-52-133]HQS57749.1 hypothetical protein [Gallionellaceae bacterium]HQS74202.1 hypothetical protein [Gallionellaceae bacterium]